MNASGRRDTISVGNSTGRGNRPEIPDFGGWIMNTRYDWSVGIGRWMGVPIRVHLLLFLGIIGVFAIDWNQGNAVPIVGTGLVTSLVLVFSIVIHELAHLWACHSLGGMAHSVTLSPWGGNSHFEYPDRPAERMVVDGAGPFVNLAVFALSSSLLLGTGQLQLQDLLNPFRPQDFSLSEWETSFLAIVAWVNFQLFVFNLIPCYPMDGVRMLRNLFWASSPHAGPAKIEATLMAISQLVAVGLILMAVVLRDFNEGPLQPVWSLWLAFGCCLLFASRFEFRQQLRGMEWKGGHATAREMDSLSSLEVREDPWSTHDPASPFVEYQEYSQWLNEKQFHATATPVDLPDDPHSEAELADQILGKLHREGIGSLSVNERTFLEQFSRRLRERRSSV